MGLDDEIGLRHREHVDGALELAWVLREALAAELGLGQGPALMERARSSVEDEDPLCHEPGQALVPLATDDMRVQQDSRVHGRRLMLRAHRRPRPPIGPGIGTVSA